jgi:Domain of unknown function (DUF4232)
MLRLRPSLAVLVAAVVGTAGCGDSHATAPCRSTQMTLSYGEAISPASGNAPRSFVLTNMASEPCLLRGYPTVAVFDAHGRIPFPIHHGPDMMISSRGPRVVRVAAHHSALFILNKFRCDGGTRRAGTTVRIGLPGQPVSRRLSVGIPFYPVLGYCGKGDGESVLTASPMVSTLAAAMAH